jgi:hypothetical protein
MEGIQQLPIQFPITSNQNPVLVQTSEQNTTNNLEGQQKIEDIRNRARGRERLSDSEIAILRNDPIYQQEVVRNRTERLLAVYTEVETQLKKEYEAEIKKINDRYQGPDTILQTFKRMKVADRVYIGAFVIVTGYIYSKMLNQIVKNYIG